MFSSLVVRFPLQNNDNDQISQIKSSLSMYVPMHLIRNDMSRLKKACEAPRYVHAAEGYQKILG